MKKEYKSQKKQQSRKRNGTKEEMVKQKERYASNLKVKERKKEYYQEEKKNQKTFQLQQEKKWRRDDASRSVIYWEDRIRPENELKYKGFKWIIDFIHHFLETFNEVCEATRNKLINLVKSIEDQYSKNKSEIDEMFKNAKIGANEYDGEPFPNHFKIENYFQRDGVYIEKIHENHWQEMKKIVERQLYQIHEQIDSHHKEKLWYKKLEKINNVYKKTIEPNWFEGKYFLKGKVCFICMDEEHRIDFDCQTIYRLHYQNKN